MPGCIREIEDTVSTIRILVTPSLFTEIEGVPHSNKSETEGAMTAFSGILRRRELSSLTPLSRFPDSLFLSANFAGF
jgi:hypothetical protein